jgi:predicted GIY-YIG superfamily endonuclease
MHYVYIIQSISHPDQRYIGYSADLKKRMAFHNAGKSPHTAKYRPWQLLFYSAFPDKTKALEFEAYLKSHSGKAFAAKRLLPSSFRRPDQSIDGVG